MEIQQQVSNHEERIKKLEAVISSLTIPLAQRVQSSFVFSDKSQPHTVLLEQLLKSDFCHSKNGLTFDEIIEVFKLNARPVVFKKIRDILGVWKKRNKVEALKQNGKLRYFWINNED